MAKKLSRTFLSAYKADKVATWLKVANLACTQAQFDALAMRAEKTLEQLQEEINSLRADAKKLKAEGKLQVSKKKYEASQLLIRAVENMARKHWLGIKHQATTSVKDAMPAELETPAKE